METKEIKINIPKGCSESTYKNRKNSGNALSEPEKSTLWSRIKKFLGL